MKKIFAGLAFALIALATFVILVTKDSATYNIETIKIGDKVGNFVVSDIAADKQDRPFSRENNVRITFKGVEILDGTYSSDAVFGSLFGVMSGADRLPHSGKNVIDTMCFSTDVATQGPLTEGERIRATISQYVVAYSEPGRDGCGITALFSNVKHIGTSQPEDSSSSAVNAVNDNKSVHYAATTTIDAIKGAAFNMESIKPGDKVGAFTVLSVKPFRISSSDSETTYGLLGRSQNIQIEFEGDAVFTGTVDTNDMVGPQITDLKNASALPHPIRNFDRQQQSVPTGFCVKNVGEIQTIPPETRVSFAVTHYTFIYYPSSVCSLATLTAVKKI